MTKRVFLLYSTLLGDLIVILNDSTILPRQRSLEILCAGVLGRRVDGVYIECIGILYFQAA